MSRLLFLSHSGVDAEAAKALKVRIESSPAAREQGLKVWFDKDDLRAGEPWRNQLEEAIARSDAFAVYVGSKGVVNWVEAEVDLGLERAVADPSYRFVPILAGETAAPESLPSFVRRYQAVFDDEARPDQFEKLMEAVFGGAEAVPQRFEENPFFGLRAIDEGHSHLFFGRKRETDELLARLQRTSLVLVTGDSGAGKSSLVRAGLVPRFRGGALALMDDTRPERTIWHVVTTRPRAHPLRQLGDAVDEAAKGLRVPLKERGTLADWAASGDIEMVRRALRCDLPADDLKILLVVDQFEELLTVTPLEQRAPFIDLLLDLADPADGRHRVVLTMRQDYVNLCNAYEPLKARLEADRRQARFGLGRVSDEGLQRIVMEPLRLAGIHQGEREALAGQVNKDVGERPGDLALVQMALTETWQARDRHGGNLLQAYAEVGRVEGALAQAAARVRADVLNWDERSLLDGILLRLVRPGDIGGATRRVAARSEFDEAQWLLVQKLASEEGKRLVLMGGSSEWPTVEIAHEALVTAWPYFRNLLEVTATEKRVLDLLIPQARVWADQSDSTERNRRLATGADLEVFSDLAKRRSDWISSSERAFVETSAAAEAARLRRELRMTQALQAIAAILLVAVFFAGWMWWRATEAESVALGERDKATAAADSARASEVRAREASRTARENESRALAALSEIASSDHSYVDAVKLAIAAWPRSNDDVRPKLRVTVDSLEQAQRHQRLVIPPMRHKSRVWGATFNGAETRVLTWSNNGTARLWNAVNGEELLAFRHESRVRGAAFSRAETRVLTWSDDGTVRFWHAVSGEVLRALRHEGRVRGAAFNGAETHVLTWSDDGTARLWDVQDGEILLVFRHESWVWGAAFNRAETRLLTWSRDGTVHLWSTASGSELLVLRHESWVRGAAFNDSETHVLTWSDDNTVRVWDAATGEELLALHHESRVRGAMYNGGETRILTWSDDNAARLWDIASGEEYLAFRHESRVRGAAFNGSETQILAWSEDGTVHLWDATSGQVLTTLRHESRVWGASFNGVETRILTWSGDGTTRLWDVASGDELLALRHESQVRGAVFNGAETRILTWSGDGTASLWDATSGKDPLAVLHESWVWGAVFNGAETRILSWSNDGMARLWDAESGKELLALRHEKSVLGAIFSDADTRILTWSGDNAVRLWDAMSGKELLALGQMSRVWGAALNNAETRILTWSEDNMVRIWDVASGEELLALRHESRVWGAALSGSETHILTWSDGGTARLWDAESGEELLALRHEDWVWGAALDGAEMRILTWSGDGTARLWDAVSGEELLALRHESWVWGATFNGAETRILTWSSDGTARLRDARSGEEVLALRHESSVLGATFNGGETRILTWSEDNTARLWDVASGKELLVLRHESSVLGAAFNGAETRILTWSNFGSARLWDISRLPAGNLFDVACGLLPDHDISELKSRYGIAIDEPICGPGRPAPVWAEFVD